MKKGQKKIRQILSLLLVAVLTASSPLSVMAAEVTDSIEVPVQEEAGLGNPEEEILAGTAESLEESTPEPSQEITEESSEEKTEADVSAEEVEIQAYANGLPSAIPAGEVFELTQDVTMESGQWFERIEGTLEGNGHTITLTDKPLADHVTGTIQNLGVTSETEIVSEATFGSMAVTLEGTIQNCYSTAKMKLNGFMGEAGGLVGEIPTGVAGVISNSYFAGQVTAALPGFYGGLLGVNSSDQTVFRNAYFGDQAGNGSVSMPNPRPQEENVDKKSLEDFQKGKVTELLNANLPDTGFFWANPTAGENRGMPVLQKSDGTLPEPQPEKPDKSALQQLVEACEAISSDRYTPESWEVFSQALSSAKAVLDAQETTKEEIDRVIAELEEAKSGLIKKKPTEPVAPPEDESKIIHISSEEELDQSVQAEGYYVLDQDITIKEMFAPFDEFSGVLDGRGHTITFEGDRPWLYQHLGENGVLQNIHFAGTIQGWETGGPIGKDLKGTIINCFTDVTGEYACGFAKRLKGGTILNSYSVSEGKKGAVIHAYESGTLVNTYWPEFAKLPELPQDALVNASSKTEEEMKSMDFVNLLNANKGTHGTAWGQNSNGYPYFGENQEYNPDAPQFPENKYEVVFVSQKDEEIPIEQQTLLTSPDETNSSGLAGHFQIKNVPETSRIEWAISEVKPERAVMIGADRGDLSILAEGTAVVTAIERKADGSSEEVAWIQVISKVQILEEIQLQIDGTDVTNGTFTVRGSEEKKIEVRAKYKGSEAYVPVNPGRFVYKIAEEELIHHLGMSTFSFKKPGTTSIQVGSKTDEAIHAEVEVTSTYVPVESVKPGIEGTKILHNVDANDYLHYAFEPDYSSVVVTPGNASYASAFTVESSNPEIADYTGTGGYVAYQAGDVTYTAKITQVNPENGKESTVSGTTSVNYQYKNPLTELIAPEGPITVDLTQKKQPLELTFKGALSEEGWNVSFPKMQWEYDKKGIVSITQPGPGYWKKRPQDEGKPDFGSFVLEDKYEINALKPGTVQVTGTPLDQTNGVQPITLEITVVGEEAPQMDMDALVQKGLEGAEQHFKKQYPTQEYSYNNNDWLVYGLLRAGKSIPEEKLNAYYDSVEEKVKTWSVGQKPTDIERIVLTLSAMGKDITNVGGKNLAEMIYNHKNLADGSNELAWALLALDAKKTEIPEDAKWSRDRMISALLTFQNAESGGFGLTDSTGTGIDITAMALQALAPYRVVKPEVGAAVEKGLSYLKQNLPADWNYGTSEAVSQVILTLTTLQIDPANSEFGTAGQNLIRALMDHYYTENGFLHTENGQTPKSLMPSVQADQALTSYVLFKNGAKSYWDLTEGGKPEIPPTPDPEKPEIPMIPIEPSKPVQPEAVGTVSLMILDGIVKEHSILQPVETSKFSLKEAILPAKITNTTAPLPESALYNAMQAEQIPSKGTILSEKKVPIYAEDTMMSIIERACKEAKIELSIREGVYIESIDGLAEFDRGPQSGWKGTLDGIFPDKSFADCTVKSGEVHDGSVLTVEYTNERLGKDLTENAELKTPGISGGTLKEEFQREQYQYTIVTEQDRITFSPELYNRYSLVTIKANDQTYAEDQEIPVEDGMVLTLTSRKNMRGEDVREYSFTIEKKEAIGPEKPDPEKPDPEKPDAGEEEKPVEQLVNKTYGITLSMSGLTSDMQLVVKKLTKEDKAVERMRKEIPSSKAIFRTFLIQLEKDGEKIEPTGNMTVSIPVGEKYDGKSLEVLQCSEEQIEKLSGTVEKGKITFETAKLDNFGVVIDAPGRLEGGASGSGSGQGGRPTGGSGSGAGGTGAKTGDALDGSVWILVMILSMGIIWRSGKARKIRKSE